MNAIELPAGILLGIEKPVERATFTLTEADCDDRRTVTVASIPDALDNLTKRCER